MSDAPASRPPRAEPSPRPRAAPRADRTPREDRPTHVYQQLRGLIVRGQLAPGTRVVETEVAEKLGVSRTPVREGLRRLEQEGYLLADPLAHQQRLTVAPLTRQDVRELLNIVGTLEGLAAYGASERPTAERTELCRALRDANAAFRRAAEARGNDQNHVYDLDEAFHRALVEAGAGARLRTLHEAVKPQAERYIRMYISLLLGDVKPSVDEHGAIITAIRKGDAEAAQLAVQTNWRHAAARLSKV
ncbi:MAG TPA: GntR family transcriptional regulator, partial [Longimicrobium sp.]|nr:GntR family transcriptional regulator [Longimicrobium sp.]